MPRLIPHLSASACLLTALGAGCDGVADPTYQGEPLATLRGQLQIQGTPPPAQVVLIWTNSDANYFAREHVDAIGDGAPTEFKLNLFGPPAEEVFIDLTNGGANPNESKVAFGLIAVMRQDTNLGLFQGDSDIRRKPEDAPRPLLGSAEYQALVYVDSNVQPGTRTASLLGGTLSAGFHLMQYDWTPQSVYDAHQACIAGLFKAWFDDHPGCDPLTAGCRPGNPACDSDPTACVPVITDTSMACPTPADATMVEAPEGLDTLIHARLPVELHSDCLGEGDCLLLPHWLE